ncbi:MAG: hypothetical protein WBG92_13380 [Thiohalocapsa sp.]
MLETNLILLLALVIMVGIALWLFKDGEGVGPAPFVRPLDSEDDAMEGGHNQQPRVRVVNDDDAESVKEVGSGPDK